MEFIEKELKRLADTNVLVDAENEDRKATISQHDDKIIELENERLNSVNWHEKNGLTEKLRDLSQFDPRKYRKEFTQTDSPYFAIFGINDNDPKIGKKEYVIGFQGFIHKTHPILDWRNADITRLFYDYEIGEEYEETIQGKDREGVLTRKDKVIIVKRELQRIETPEAVFELADDGVWHKNGAEFYTTSNSKSVSKDHRMVDIVALISAEQFNTITEMHSGVVLLEGGAGSGKTTVAIHRASFLMFDAPDIYRPERTLVVMFNRSLATYVKKTSEALLGVAKVDTFSAWALTALSALAVKNIRTVFEDPFTSQKKDEIISDLLPDFVARTPKQEDPVSSLWKFYLEQVTLSSLFPGDEANSKAEFVSEIEKRIEVRSRKISFADIGVLLRLVQLRQRKDAVVTGALNWFDHIIIDEAQDFSSIEMECMIAASSPARSLTICADEDQKILSFLKKSGFSRFKLQLQKMGLNKKELTVSYRCPKEIIDLAARVSNRKVDSSKAHPGVLEYFETNNLDHAIEQVRFLVDMLAEVDPNALTAVICKKKSDVKTVHAALEGYAGLQPLGDQTFEPGIVVTNAHQVKGLEYTFVILFDPSSYDYRETEVDQNLLYVAITRACKRLYIVYYHQLAKALRIL